MIRCESIEENHIMMALLDHYLPSDDNITFWDRHLHWGDADTKIKPITLSTLVFPKQRMASFQIEKKKKNMLYSVFSIKSLLAVWNKVNIAALKIHIWAEQLVFAEGSYFNFFCLLKTESFQKCKDIPGNVLIRNLENGTDYVIPEGIYLLLRERFQVDSIFKNPFLAKERQVVKTLDTS